MKASKFVTEGIPISLNSMNDLQFLCEMLNRCGHYYLSEFIARRSHILPFRIRFEITHHCLHLHLLEGWANRSNLHTITQYDLANYQAAQYPQLAF